jgi:hypothetical protein
MLRTEQTSSFARVTLGDRTTRATNSQHLESHNKVCMYKIPTTHMAAEIRFPLVIKTGTSFAFLAHSSTVQGRRPQMRKLFYAFAVGTLAGAMAIPAFALAGASNANSHSMQMASVKTGNTIIEAGGASNADLNVARYKAWDEFRDNHPDVVHELRHNPRMAGNQGFLKRHRDLAQLFDSNPGLQKSMLRHPGNYIVPVMAYHHRNARAAG